MKIEDIYPLTIVAMRFGKFAIVETIAAADCVQSLQEDEEWQYYPNDFMMDEWSHVRYGIGDTIAEAFENFKSKGEIIL